MIVDAALEQALRTLKLSGMLQTLESRPAQAAPATGRRGAGGRQTPRPSANRQRLINFPEHPAV